MDKIINLLEQMEDKKDPMAKIKEILEKYKQPEEKAITAESSIREGIC